MLFFIFSLTVLKLLKMAKGIRALLDTVMQALPQVGNLGLLFFLLFFIFAALGVELFGRLGMYECNFNHLRIFTEYEQKNATRFIREVVQEILCFRVFFERFFSVFFNQLLCDSFLRDFARSIGA